MMRSLGATSAKRLISRTLVSAQAVRPSSPAQPHLHTYHLSPLDRASPARRIPVVLFFPNHGGPSSYEKTSRLKQSLSETLALYYPFAGRMSRGAVALECSNEGVEFCEARIDDGMDEVLGELDHGELDDLFPEGSLLDGAYEGGGRRINFTPLAVQVNHFDCGGMAVAVSMSHKVGDESTVCTFIKHWALLAQGTVPSNPYFLCSATATPPVGFLEVNASLGNINYNNNNKNHNGRVVTKKFVFSSFKISEAMAKANEAGPVQITNPTRDKVVKALLYKCAVDSSTATQNSGSPRSAVFNDKVNLRDLIAGPVPRDSVGNFYRYITIPTRDESEMRLSVMTAKIKKASMRLRGLKVSDAPMRDPSTMDGLEAYSFNSLAGYSLPETDFGWGKPVGVTAAGGGSRKNHFTLWDAPSGIEAVVSLEEEDMRRFQTHEDITSFSQ